MKLLMFLLPLVAGIAEANPRPLAFSYTTETMPKDGTEVEQIIDMTPVRALDLSGGVPLMPAWTLVTELEHGITDRLELGLYTQFSVQPGLSTGGALPLQFDGVKQRLRYRMSGDDWPVQIALYGEVAELTTETELEGKVIVQRRVGPMRAVVNLWFEREFYYAGRREWVANPTLGLTYELAPAFHVGLEGWARKEWADETGLPAGVQPSAIEVFNTAWHGYVGPNVLCEFGRVWWTAGVYERVDQWDRASQVGDAYGRIWVRTLIGYGF